MKTRITRIQGIYIYIYIRRQGGLCPIKLACKRTRSLRFTSPLSGQVKGPGGQGRVPFLASFDRCQGLRIDDHADYHSALSLFLSSSSRKGLRFFFFFFSFPFFARKTLPVETSFAPEKWLYARIEGGGGGGNSVSFDARSKMDLRGGGGERKAVFKQKKKKTY